MATSSNAAELGKRRGRPPKGTPSPNEQQTFALYLVRLLQPALHAAAGRTFPDPYYQTRPVEFARDVLGVEPWSKQVEILEAVRDHDRVAIKSGHKVGKSMSAAILALWYYCSWENARCVMTSTTSRQVDEILWRELRMRRAQAGKCYDCKVLEAEAQLRGERLTIPKPCPHSTLIDGELGDTARTGLKSDDFREIIGFTAKQAEAVAGISGANVLYFIDEASGVPQVIFDAIEGNRAGDAKVVMFSNPTKNEGEFYDAFNSKSRFYKTITISSLETPNYISGEKLVPGLATRDYIESKREEWGENSALFKVRIKGEFAEHEAGKIFSLHMIAEAEQRWSDPDAEPAAGRLYIGLDPAGESGHGDDIAFSVRRGMRVSEIGVRQGLNEEGHLALVLELIKKHKHARETPVVVMDSDGSVGSKVYFAIRTFSDANPGVMELVRIRNSDDSARQPELYPKMRDALTASLHAWFEAGGAIPEDTKLEKELHSMEWRQLPNGKQKVTDKATLRKILGRSPDRYDSLAMCVWEPLSLREEAANDNGTPPPARRQDNHHYDVARSGLDPYAGSDHWGRR